MKHLQFYVKVHESGNQTVSFWFVPVEKLKVFEYYNDVCESVEEFDDLIDQLQQHQQSNIPKYLGENEASILVNGKKTILNCEYVSRIPPLEIDTEEAIFFFKKYREFQIKFSNMNIPGIIPESKIGTWSCVPNEYVKKEYWLTINNDVEED